MLFSLVSYSIILGILLADQELLHIIFFILIRCQCLVDIQRHRISNVFTAPLNDDFIFQPQDLRLHDDNITNVSALTCSRVGGIVVSIAAFQAVDSRPTQWGLFNSF